MQCTCLTLVCFLSTNNPKHRWGGVTTMQPTYARIVTPCFDEPEFKALFDVTIRHRSDMTALSNGIELSITDLGGDMSGWKETVFKTTPLMSTYLLAFTVNHFVSMNATTDTGTLVCITIIENKRRGYILIGCSIELTIEVCPLYFFFLPYFETSVLWFQLIKTSD